MRRDLKAKSPILRFDGMAAISSVALLLLELLSAMMLARAETSSTYPDDPFASNRTWPLADEARVRSRRHVTSEKIACQSLPRELLRKILGPAYNPRYMSFDRPEVDEGPQDKDSPKSSQRDQNWQHHQKHGQGADGRRKVDAFHVHDTYSRILYDEPVVPNVEYEIASSSRLLDDVDDATTSTTTSTRPTDDLLSATIKAAVRNGGSAQRSKSSTANKKLVTRLQQPKHSTSVKGRHSSRREQQHFKNEEFEQIDQPSWTPTSQHRAETQHGRYRYERQRDAANRNSNSNMDRGRRETAASERFLRSIRRSRRNVKNGFPWACESKIEWLDLGPNHFPRFLRSVVCTSDKCWFGHFQCRPKAFTVKILRRRKDSCIVKTTSTVAASAPVAADGDADHHRPSSMSDEDFNSHVPPEFREQWTFEERAVTFCCECAA